ncbi:hypothetical protein QO010_002707 [Caulobacter ginsengisoli]|uniref:DUF1223 domain-containing protein n=1 Tax=Caulobacter ginsengisoli TaxID=400775 RepID=A0ABU0IUW3_9CAUL|nr:DUF1223 domain-containing protein [Caulobacter ginsengisoli]MDQ0464923.1 hypothetical protein [Caulobacter ginsengisoli]
MKSAFAAFLVWAFAAALASPVAAAPAKPPVLVELFTAQGCSSCNDAGEHFNDLAQSPGVLALTFSVDYWDYLGWEDSFARPEFVERQRAYVRGFGLREVYTPQVVVGGRSQVSGVRAAKVDALVAQAAKTPIDPPDMLFMAGGRVAVGSGRVPRGGADVWLIRYDPRLLEVQVRRGDNKGRTLTERNVVRELVKLGAWKGRPTAYKLPAAKTDGLVTVVVVQAPRGGRVLGLLQDMGR